MFESLGLSVPVVVGTAAVVGATTLFLLSNRSKGKKCVSETDLTGRTVIVTGGNAGIGFWTAQDFATRGAKVILACHSLERGGKARDEIVATTGNQKVVVRHLDLFDFASVRRFVEQTVEEDDRLDILVNNAGVFGMPQEPSEHGLENTMASNHFGPFLLTVLLADLLKKSSPSRIVTVSSEAQYYAQKGIDFDNLHGEKPQSNFSKYAISKLANVLFTRELARRLKGTGVTAYCVHPGMVATNIGRNMLWVFRLLMRPIYPFLRTGNEGAQTSIYLSVAEEVKDESGKYYVDCALAEHKVNPLANDPELAKKLWEVSAELTGVSGDI